VPKVAGGNDCTSGVGGGGYCRVAQPVTIHVPINKISTNEFFIKHPVIFHATEIAPCLWVARLINIKMNCGRACIEYIDQSNNLRASREAYPTAVRSPEIASNLHNQNVGVNVSIYPKLIGSRFRVHGSKVTTV
jgi:hypothetical protein